MTQPNPPEIESLTRIQILTAMAVTALILLLVAKGWQTLGNVPLLSWEINQNAFVWGIALALIIIGASGIVYRFWPAYSRCADIYLQLVLKPLVWPDLIWLGLLPGLSEELLFRGVMLPALGLNWTALILSSALFGILHLSGADQWPYALWACLVGLLLGYSALATQNLLVPIIAHILTNFISSCLWKSTVLNRSR